MLKHATTALILGGIAFSVHGADGTTPIPAEYVSTTVLQSADVALNGDGLPGAPVDTWIAKSGDDVVFLQGDWTELLGEVHQLGDVSVLSGNETVMHLATGQYDPFRGGEGHAMVLNQGIDLRLFPGHWEYGAAILPGADSAPGFIFFNGAGDPVHRILLTATSDVDAFNDIVETYKGTVPEFSPWSEEQEVTETPTEATKAALLEDWRALTDTHAFGRLLHKHKLSRTEALRLAEGEFTEQLDSSTYGSIFSQLVDQEISIILFALNNGCVQISTGALTQLSQTRTTIQLVERDSRTLIALPRIEEAWRVSKPTSRGMAYSLELYDGEGEAVAYIFGSRKGDDENAAAFQQLLYALPMNGAKATAVSSEGEDAKGGATCSSKATAASSEQEKGACSDEKAVTCEKATAASSEGEEKAGTCEKAPVATATSAKVAAVSEPIDTFNLPRRVRSQLNYTVKRMLAFDKNEDGRLSGEELPQRMKGLLEKGDQNKDLHIDEEELLAMAYHQMKAREAEGNRSEESQKH